MKRQCRRLRAASRARLLWIANTDADVFTLGKDGPVHFLVSGRWFRATGFEGPWTFTTPDLPDDFKKSRPPTSDRGCSPRCRAPTTTRRTSGMAGSTRSTTPTTPATATTPRVQPEDGHVRRHETGLGRLRQLGSDGGAARRSMGPARRASPSTGPARQRVRPRAVAARTGSGEVARSAPRSGSGRRR